jgi:hypothetical protein
MAWRIHDCVIRGEIDNRERDRVRGKVWLCGIVEPVILELKGNACADLAGCLLTFENPLKPIPMRSDDDFGLVQQGTIGDLTASRKVRVMEMPVGEAYMRKKQGLSVPEHLANSLYLEWFSQANGRVVIESADYKLTVTEPEWRLTPDQEDQRQQAAAEGFTGFLEKMGRAVEAQHHEPPPDKEWDEFDYEKFMRESDARTDKYSELLDKYMDHPDRDRIVAHEMGWTWLEEALDEQQRESADGAVAQPAHEEDEFDDDSPFDSPDDSRPLEPDASTEGIDWIRNDDGRIGHPLAQRASDGSVALWRRCKDLGLGEMDDADIAELMSEYQIAAAKLAGALNGLAFGRHLREGAFIVAYLKRGLHHLHAAQAGLEKVAAKNLLPCETIAATRAELFEIRQEILKLMKEFRGEKG